MNIIDLSGEWTCELPGLTAAVRLPGTLDESGVGFPDRAAGPWHPDAQVNGALANEQLIATRLTRKYTFEGAARLTRQIETAIQPNARVFLEAERARCLSVFVNGAPAPAFEPPTLSTPQVFELTGLLSGRDEIALILDNSYPGLPRADILASSAATDETQTNWNGVIGFLRLRVERPVFIRAVRVYPRGERLDVCVELSAGEAWRGDIALRSAALLSDARIQADVPKGEHTFWARALPLKPDARRWDEDEGNLYALDASSDGLDARSVSFGIRDFRANAQGRLTLNGRVIFLRGEANCAVFPETGHQPMDEQSWTHILQTYRDYGVNCMRFHSHVPPEAAFFAADQLGMLMQPELSHWNPRDALESDEAYAYYGAELRAVLARLANHPSFVMLTLGNELCAGEKGRARMAELVRLARALDDTRLYAAASNAFYGAKGCDDASDFYASQAYFSHQLRATCANMEGYLNHQYPNAKTDYSPAIREMRKACFKPVFSFEVGQYEVLPDFDELNDFRGVTRPDNVARVRRAVDAKGLAPEWARRVEASGELSLLCYREEVEAALRTEGLSGISLLGLQDFPGQGTALVGMLSSHLNPKPFPFARPERFRAFFTDCLPLVYLDRYTYEDGDALLARVRMANYGKRALSGRLRYTLSGEGVFWSGELNDAHAPCGGPYDAGTLELTLEAPETPNRLTLSVEFCGYENQYPLWVYPRVTPMCPDAIYETERLDARAEEVLKGGGRVLLAPPADEAHQPRSIQTQFSTDFWSVGTFPSQPGGMGQLIDAAHPLFKRFPTETHTNWQWWPMAGTRAMILPANWRAIVTQMDSYAYLRSMAQLFEGRCGGGRVLVCSMGLRALSKYPEARALQSAIYQYMISAAFVPTQELPLSALRDLAR